MRKTSFLSALLLLFTHWCDAEYIAAVVEYNPVTTSSPTITIEENIKNYVYQIEMAQGFGVKMIVFPEYGLTGLIDDPTGYGIQVPNVGTSDFSTTNSSYFLLRLSNAAKEHNIYVVVNLIEQTYILATNESFYYNSNLVFSNNGTLVAKYRKINLNAEPKLTAGTDIVTFTTDFGVFGLMTCADILYYNPSQTMLMKNTGVTDVIFPSSWTSYLPFYASLEVQVGYALANNVNLLASNINNPLNGTGGSGIYTADGTALRTILTDTPATNFIHANVLPPTSVRGSFSLMGFDILDNNTNTRQELAGYKNLTYFKYDSYVFKPLDLSQENITAEICSGKFCCNFNIMTWKNETNSSEVYKLVAYRGKADFDKKQVSVKHCNLVACLTDDIRTCGVRPSTPYTTRFRQILVWGNFDNQPEDYYRPSSLRGNLQPVYNVTYLESKTNESYGVSFNSTQPVANVVMFGLYGHSGAETLGVSLLLVAIIVAIKGIF